MESSRSQEDSSSERFAAGWKHDNIITFTPNDPEDPRNWPTWRRWLLTGPIVLIDLSVSFAASGYSPATMNFEKDMGVSSEVGVLGLSLYVLGLALGPMTLAPLSEVRGLQAWLSVRRRFVQGRGLNHCEMTVLRPKPNLHMLVLRLPVLSAGYSTCSKYWWLSGVTHPVWNVLECDYRYC